MALCAWLFPLSITRLICILPFSIPAPGRQWRKISHCLFSVSPLVHWLPWQPISFIVTKTWLFLWILPALPINLWACQSWQNLLLSQWFMVFASTVCLFLLVVDSCSFKKDDEIQDVSRKAEPYPGPTHDLYRSPGQPTYHSIISSGNEDLRNLDELPERRK